MSWEDKLENMVTTWNSVEKRRGEAQEKTISMKFGMEKEQCMNYLETPRISQNWETWLPAHDNNKIQLSWWAVVSAVNITAVRTFSYFLYTARPNSQHKSVYTNCPHHAVIVGLSLRSIEHTSDCLLGSTSSRLLALATTSDPSMCKQRH